MINNISFFGKYHYLQNQKDLPCAYCGESILNNAQIKEIHKTLEGKKGEKIAEVLEPFLYVSDGKGKEFLAQMIYFSKLPRFKDWKFKQLSLLGSEDKIYNADSKKTVENMLQTLKFSVEHAEPRNNGGLNRQSNYLPMHSGCNEMRGDCNYGEILVEKPDLVANIRKSLLEIKRRMNSDKMGITHYNIHLKDDYFSEIKENLEKQGLAKELFADI